MDPTTQTTDPYQERYLAHQARKKEVLIEIMKERHSNRMFDDKEVGSEEIQMLLNAANLAPSSCDRHGVRVKIVIDRDEKALLGGLLVGGVGWIHRAPVIFLLYADPLAYKAGDEIGYMPYLDAGCMIQQLYLSATSIGLHCAYANPNIREGNLDHFHETFLQSKPYKEEKEYIYCGAFAFGWPHPNNVPMYAAGLSEGANALQAMENKEIRREPVVLSDASREILRKISAEVSYKVSNVEVEEDFDPGNETTPGWMAIAMYKEGQTSPAGDGHLGYWAVTQEQALQFLLEAVRKGEV